MISIISSLYKSGRHLNQFQKALKGFAQDLQRAGVDFEIIAIVNEPTEAEKKFAADFANQPWFKFTEAAREPLYASWNRGINLARGGVVGFWNADDVRFAESVIEAGRLFAQGAELVYFPFIVKRYLSIGSLSLPLPGQTMDKQIPEFNATSLSDFKKSMFCGPFFMFTKSLYEKVGPFDEQFKIAGDFDWCARAAHKTDKFVKAKTVGGVFRVDGGGLSAGTNPRRVAENNVIYMRNHVWEKIVVAEDLIIKDYRPKNLKYQGVFSAI